MAITSSCFDLHTIGSRCLLSSSWPLHLAILLRRTRLPISPAISTSFASSSRKTRSMISLVRPVHTHHSRVSSLAPHPAFRIQERRVLHRYPDRPWTCVPQAGQICLLVHVLSIADSTFQLRRTVSRCVDYRVTCQTDVRVAGMSIFCRLSQRRGRGIACCRRARTFCGRRAQ